MKNGNGWHPTPLREILIRSGELIEIHPEEQYKEVTVRMRGGGVCQRRMVDGVEIAAQKRFAVQSQQFIVSRIDARHGAMGIIPDILHGAVVTNDFPVFTIDQTKVLPDFLGWLSKTEDFIELCRVASEGTTNRVRLQEDLFLALQIPLPPLEEQRHVVARIEELAGQLAEARELQASIQEDARRMLLSAYIEIIKDAEWKPMAKVAPLERRPVEVELEQEYAELGIYSFGRGTFHKPAMTGAALGTKRIFEIHEGDLLFQIVFAWEGAVAVAKCEDHRRVGSHRFLTCVPIEGCATAPFLRFHFLTDQGLEQLGTASPGGAGRNRTLGLKALEAIPVPVPDVDKQQWFDSLQSQVDTLKQEQAASTAELDALLPAVLDRAFKGEL
jgi:type I restriction enzyme S subunit